MSADVAVLQEAPLFALLDDQERKTLAEIIDVVTFDKGATIFSFGDVGDTLYIVQSGAVQVFVENYEGSKIILAENTRGDIFGEISLLDGGPRTATAVATEDTQLFALERQDLLDLITKHPHAAMDLLTVVGRRLRATDEMLRTHVAKNVNEEEEEQMTFGEHIADKVAAFGGSWTFIIFFGFILLCWAALNTILLHDRGFDPYPYILLNLFLSMLASLQAPVIMMSQNRQSSKDRLKADLDYEVNLKAELEVAQLHNKVDKIYEEMQAHFDRMHKSQTGAIASAAQGTRK
jgi:CRP/FNR family transcriptional regulator, cyclic AMP receptor protein